MKHPFTFCTNFLAPKNETPQFVAKSISHFFKSTVFLLILFISTSVAAQNEFITEWKTDNPGVSPNNAILIPAQGSFSYTWNRVNGPGSGSGTGNGITTITFPTVGNYRVKMTPTGASPFHAIQFKNHEGDSEKITKLTQWGNILWSTMESAFAGTEKLEVTATDTPNLQMVTNMSEMFNHSKVSSIPNINSWDVSEVKNMEKMFHFSPFNSDISGWDVGKVTNMSMMFYGASDFNNIIGGWDVKNVKNFFSTFYGAYLFDQDLGAWNLSSALTLANMFGANMSCENYSKTLAGWAANDAQTPSDIIFNVLQMEYSPDVVAARNHLINVKNWTISGDSLGTCAVLATADTAQNKVSVFPNPAREYVMVNGLKGDETVFVYDLQGRLLRTLKAGAKKMQVDLSQYAAGTYLLRISSESGSTTEKIIKH